MSFSVIRDHKNRQHGPSRGKHPSRPIHKMGKQLRKKRMKIAYRRWGNQFLGMA